MFVFIADCAITSVVFAGPTKRASNVIAGDVNGNVHFLKIPKERRQSNMGRISEMGSSLWDAGFPGHQTS